MSNPLYMIPVLWKWWRMENGLDCHYRINYSSFWVLRAWKTDTYNGLGIRTGWLRHSHTFWFWGYRHLDWDGRRRHMSKVWESRLEHKIRLKNMGCQYTQGIMAWRMSWTDETRQQNMLIGKNELNRWDKTAKYAHWKKVRLHFILRWRSYTVLTQISTE